MNENLIAFYSRIRGDESVIAELNEFNDMDGMIKRASEIGGDMGLTFTPEEAMDGLKNLREVIAQVANQNELSDMELELVSGGTTCNNGGAPKID